MPTTRFGITIDEELLKQLNELVEELRRDKVLKPRKMLMIKNPRLSRSQVVCECIRYSIETYRQEKREEARRRAKQKALEERWKSPTPKIPMPPSLLRKKSLTFK